MIWIIYKSWYYSKVNLKVSCSDVSVIDIQFMIVEATQWWKTCQNSPISHQTVRFSTKSKTCQIAVFACSNAMIWQDFPPSNSFFYENLIRIFWRDFHHCGDPRDLGRIRYLNFLCCSKHRTVLGAYQGLKLTRYLEQNGKCN